MKTRYAGVLVSILFLGLTGAATATEPAAASRTKSALGHQDAQSIQRALHYEWVLGVELGPEMTACLDIKLGTAWPVPSSSQHEVPERLLERIQRAQEACSAYINADRLDHDKRFITAAMGREWQAQIRARRAQEDSQRIVRACMKASEQAADFKRCLTKQLPALLTELNWPQWLDSFERYRGRLPMGHTGNTG